MQKSLALLPTEMSVGIAEDEADGREEVTLPGTIAADNDVVFGGEWLNNRLIFVAKFHAGSMESS